MDELQLPEHKEITTDIEQRNVAVFVGTCWLAFFAAPVTYVGVVQAALLRSLGAGATVANLPESGYLLGYIAPVLLTPMISPRLDRAVVVLANAAIAATLVGVALALCLPLGDPIKKAVVIMQGPLLGGLASSATVYGWQCLRRGTTIEGRSRALRAAYSFSPISGVMGSLAAQAILGRRIPGVVYPYDFALLYGIGALCTGGVACLAHRYCLPTPQEEGRLPFWQDMAQGIRDFTADRVLVLAWVAYLLFNLTFDATTNLSLYTQHAIGRDPKELSGVIMALRFGFKCAGGFVLGSVAIRYGARAPLAAAIGMVGAGILWAWAVPGYSYLLAFGWMGAGELGGVYFPNYVVAASSSAAGARNLAILNLVIPACGLAPAMHGALADRYGFPASFAVAGAAALAGLWVVSRLRSRPGA